MSPDPTPDVRDAIVDVLCSLALANHLGDVRDAESGLWALIGAPPLPPEHPAWDKSAWRRTRTRLLAAGLSLPDYLADDDEL